jgi:hypothetical protein
MSMHALPPRKSGPALEDRATADLRYIRSAMVRSGRFTALSGPGIAAMGVVGGAAAALSAGTEDANAWIRTWLVAAAIAAAAGIAGLVVKARQEAQSAFSPPTRRFLLGFLPPVVAGAVLTIVLFRTGQADLLPGLWLILYGAGVVTGGQASIALLPLTGTAFMAIGAAALWLPPVGQEICMGAGFGGLHLLTGILIWRRHGG